MRREKARLGGDASRHVGVGRRRHCRAIPLAPLFAVLALTTALALAPRPARADDATGAEGVTLDGIPEVTYDIESGLPWADPPTEEDIARWERERAEEDEASELSVSNEADAMASGVGAATKDLGSVPNPDSEPLPTKFDWRDYGVVSTPKLQKLGNCYAFAIFSQLEINLIKNGIWKGSTAAPSLASSAAMGSSLPDPNGLDLYEEYLSYAYFKRDDDPLHLTTYILNNEGYGNFLEKGANVPAVALSLFTWLGCQETCEFKRYTTGTSSNLTFKKESLASYSKYVPKELVFLDGASRDEIKRAILKYGGVAFAYGCPDGLGEKTYFNNPSGSGKLHAVCIVGWDDSVETSKFQQNQPKENGAWIIKNSWGESVGDSATGKGYQYFSYETPIKQLVAIDMASTVIGNADTADVARSDGVAAVDGATYFYDGCSSAYSNNSLYPKATQSWAANVFTAQRSTADKQERLTAVNVGVAAANTKVEVDVYSAPTSSTNPLSGTRLTKESLAFTSTHNGVYTVELKEPIAFEAGDQFVCAVHLSNEKGNANVMRSSLIRAYAGGSWFSEGGSTWRNARQVATGAKDYQGTPARIKAVTVLESRDEPLEESQLLSSYEVKAQGPTTVSFSGHENLLDLALSAKDGQTLDTSCYDLGIYADEQCLQPLESATNAGTYWLRAEPKAAEPRIATAQAAQAAQDSQDSQDARTSQAAKASQAGQAAQAVASASTELVGASKAVKLVVSPTSVERVTWTLERAKWSNGAKVEPKITAKLGSYTLRKGIDYTISCYNDTAPGTATCIISGIGNFTSSVSRTYTIYKPTTSSTTKSPASGSAVRRVPMHRLYNPNSGEHFYTANVAERDHLMDVGWRYENVGWIAPSTSKSPVYRLYNPNAGDHHYTMSKAEKDMLVGVGWNYEGIGWYSADAGTSRVELWRQYNPNALSGSHNYTTSKDENALLIKLGWKGEGVGWYGLK